MYMMEDYLTDDGLTTRNSLGELEYGSEINNTINYLNSSRAEVDVIHNPVVQAIFSVIYVVIFILGLFGNVLVCYVVGRNKAMQTVTNLFITNLALSDILLLSLAVPFTPIYTFLKEWVFGKVLCHLVSYAQGTSVYISTLTLTSIAIDRFRLIISPFKPRMKLKTCFLIITLIWIFSLLATLPYGIFLSHQIIDDKYACIEVWPTEVIRQLFSWCTAVSQFVFPFIIISFCYVRVSLKLKSRAKTKLGSKSTRKEEIDKERKRRTNRMLIVMVVFFGVSWLPLNVMNLLNDVSIHAEEWTYYNLCFFIAHAIAMTSTCYNPFLYAWLNENFRKEFKQVIGDPCLSSTQSNLARPRRFLSERTCNGNETVQESFVPAASQAGPANVNPIARPLILETIDEQTSNSQTVAVNYDQMTVKFSAGTNQVEMHTLQVESSEPEETRDD